MFNSFGPYEHDFQEWWDSKEFAGVSPLTSDFLEHLLREDATRKLWRHQQEAILRVVYSYELLQMKNVLLNIVTGGGKTAIIGAVVSWLKVCHGIDKFLLLCPNTVVRDRLEDDFRNAHVFRDFGFFPPGTEHYSNELGLHLLESGAGPQGMLENGVVLGNIHQLYQSNISGKRNLAFVMKYIDRIAVFNDEAHNTPAPEYDNVLYALSKKSAFRLDTTATPDRADGKTPDSKMIYEYGIADAQSEVPPIIKSIMVYQPRIKFVQLTYTNPETGERRTVDEMDEEFEKIEKGLTATQWVTDPDPMRKQIGIAIARLKEQNRRAQSLAKGIYKPLLFVVAICIKDAEQARDMLEKEFKMKALLVTEQSDEQDRKAARLLGKPGSEYEAVVSVLMLREGWDVPPVSVILLLRKFSSPVYGQQVVGRGLRLNVRDEDLQEICAIVDHEKLKHQWLWDTVGARIRTDVDEQSLFGDEDLPPRRKPQVLVNPDLLIPVPEPEEDEKADFDDEIARMEVIEGDYPNWPDVINGFEYAPETEISTVIIDQVEGKTLRPGGFVELFDAPDFASAPEAPYEEMSLGELADKLKHSVRDIADGLLADAGIGSHELAYFYGVLMDHLRTKFLKGSSLGTADIADVKDALNHRHRLYHWFRDKPGLVASIVKYKEKAVQASE